MTTIRDLISGETHVLDAATPAILVNSRDRRCWTSENPVGLDYFPDQPAAMVAEMTPGQWAYVRSDDEGETPGSVVWWLSECMA